MNRLQIKIMVLKFCSSCYLRLLAAPSETLEHLCKSCDNRKPCLVLSLLMFKPEKNLKLSLNRHDFFFFPRLVSVRFVSQTFANDVPHGYESFKASL